MIGTEPQRAKPGGRTALRAVVAAVCFLTRLPLGRWIAVDGEDVARAGAIFPLVGAGTGAAVGATALALLQVLSAWLAAVLALTVGTVLTGALHLDALADTADALGAGSRRRALEIMREHTIGAYGAVAVALELLLKAGALTALGQHGNVLPAAVVAGALSRAAPVALATFLPYARNQGLAAPLAGSPKLRGLSAALLATGLAVGLIGRQGALLAAVALVLSMTLAAIYRRWLGGVTGDTLGAAVELIEVAILVTAAGLAGTR